jgi:PAS domain-containing protein
MRKERWPSKARRQQAISEALDRMRRGVFGLDMTGRIVFANRAAQALLAAGDK